MAFASTAIRIVVASPSDVVDARDAVERALHSWNDAHSERRRVVLLPWRWESGAIPVLGDSPQAIINLQGIDKADIVIALFGSRLGSPTSAAVSGTVEEIERATGNGRPVHAFFSTAPLPHDVDIEQLTGLRDFKRELGQRGLYGEYHNPIELGVAVWSAIELDLDHLDIHAPSASSAPVADPVRFLVQLAGSRSDQWLDVTNRSMREDAMDVTLMKEGEWAGHVVEWTTPTVVHAEQSRQAPVLFTLGGSQDPPAVRLRWNDSMGSQTKVFYIR